MDVLFPNLADHGLAADGTWFKPWHMRPSSSPLPAPHPHRWDSITFSGSNRLEKIYNDGPNTLWHEIMVSVRRLCCELLLTKGQSTSQLHAGCHSR